MVSYDKERGQEKIHDKTPSGGREVVAHQYRRQHTPAGGFFDSTATYDVEGNLTSQKLPGAPNDYYEVFQMEYSGADRIVSRALSTDAVYDAVSRLQTFDYPAATTMASAAPDVGFTYDTAREGAGPSPCVSPGGIHFDFAYGL